jgi:hypothetical protein
MLLLADSLFAIDAQQDKRSSFARLASRLQLDHTTKHKSCHVLLLICMSFDEQSAPIETRSLCAIKGKRKKYSQKECPENVVAGRFVVCDRRAARQAQFVARLASRLQLVHTTKHKSCHLLLLICMSFDEQSAPIDTRSLCARKRKRKKIFTKRFPRECCLLADSSFGIDAQQVKRGSLQDSHPGHIRYVQLSTSLAICFC